MMLAPFVSLINKAIFTCATLKLSQNVGLTAHLPKTKNKDGADHRHCTRTTFCQWLLVTVGVSIVEITRSIPYLFITIVDKPLQVQPVTTSTYRLHNSTGIHEMYRFDMHRPRSLCGLLLAQQLLSAIRHVSGDSSFSYSVEA